MIIIDCPDLDTLVDMVSDETTAAPELRAHVAACSKCRGEWSELRSVRAALSDSARIPSEWTDRIIQQLPSDADTAPRRQELLIAALVTAGLSALTVALASVLLTPGSASASPAWHEAALLAILVAGFAAVLEVRNGLNVRRSPRAWT